MIITIDGPAGTGKTTVAKTLAEELGFTYFDTGAMYRAITYGIIKNATDPENAEALRALLNANPVTIKSHFGEKHFFLGDEDVTTKIRTQDVTNLVSKVAAIGLVREKLVQTQRDLSKGVNAVFEGRDMGTAVFPDADLKIYLTAELPVRAERRRKELVSIDPANASLSLEQVMENIDRRDKYDASRDLSPMKPADDAIIIDTSHIDVDEVVNRIITIKELKDKPRTSA